MKLPGTKGRLGLAAGMVGGSVGVALLSGFGPAPALSSIGSSHDDATTTTTAVPASVPASTASDASETRSIDAAGAGTVVVAREGNQLTLISATPNAGFAVEVEQDAGAEIEVDFRMGGQRVQVNVEVEDGVIRERVRARDEVAGTDVRIENGVVVRAEGFDDTAGDDNSGPGSANSGPGNAGDVNDDHGNDGVDDDVADDVNDDHGNDGAVDDHGHDAGVDDHGGSGSSGSGGGTDDPAGDDHSGRG